MASNAQVNCYTNLRAEASTSMGNRINTSDVENKPDYSPVGLDTPEILDDQLPPSYEFILEQAPRPARTSVERNFRPPPLNQITSEDALRTLDYAEYAWEHRKWPKAQTHYSTAAAIFRIIGDLRNEAFCLQRLGEVCRIQRDFTAAQAHILQAHILFGQCGEVARQLMCERWLARTAIDAGNQEEGWMLLQSALENSRATGMRESEGWCLLRLGETKGADRNLIQQALDIAQEEKLSLLEERCRSAFLLLEKKETPPTQMPKATSIASPSEKPKPVAEVEATPTQQGDPKPQTSSLNDRIGRWFRGPH